MLAFDVNKTVSYWLNGAKYDLTVANAMFNAKKYPAAMLLKLREFMEFHFEARYPEEKWREMGTHPN